MGTEDDFERAELKGIPEAKITDSPESDEVRRMSEGPGISSDGNEAAIGKNNPKEYPFTLTDPPSGSVLKRGTVFKGEGIPFAITQVVMGGGNQDVPISTSTIPGLDRIWEADFTQATSQDEQGFIEVVARCLTPLGQVLYTDSATYQVLPRVPTITAPDANSLQPQTFVVSGNNGLRGATVNIYLDWRPTSVGHVALSADGNWSVSVTVPVGPVSLVAEQTLNGRPSGRGTQRRFKIKPPTLLDIDVSYLSSGTVRFSGAGYDTATVDVHITGNGTPLGSDVVRNGTWSVDWNDAPPGRHQMDIRQKVADGSGWINSDWSRLPVTIPVPTPTLRVQVGADRKPVFSGTGDSRLGPPAPQIEVRREGESLPAVPIVEVGDNDAWSSLAAEAWAPGIYRVQAWQLFNDLPSEPTDLQQLIINAPLPTVSVSEDGLTPHFSGTCLNGAQVNLGFDGDTGTPYDATVTGTTWTFTRPEPFTPGSYTARVTQTVGGQTSNPATQAFNAHALQPVITSPINEEVDHNPVITGTGGIAGAVMTVFDNVTEAPLNHAPVSGNDWSVPLEDLQFGPHRVYVVQTKDGSPSERSEAVSFDVILFPPTIDHPQPGDDLARGAVIDGYARTVSGTNTAQVELWLDGEDEPLARVRARGFDGYWTYDHDLPVGDYVLRAKQFFAGQPSSFGPDHLFTVVPALPLIESPTPQQHIGSTVTVSGFGYAGDWVEVAWSGAPETLLGRAEVQANRTWSLHLPIDRPAGPLQWMVQQERNGYRSGWSEAHEVRMLPGAPTFTAPEAGHWFTATPLFEGTGETGKRIELSHWFDSRQVVSQGDPITAGTWTASPDAPLLPGPHWMKARQDDSDWGDSLRFEVARVEDNRDW